MYDTDTSSRLLMVFFFSSFCIIKWTFNHDVIISLVTMIMCLKYIAMMDFYFECRIFLVSLFISKNASQNNFSFQAFLNIFFCCINWKWYKMSWNFRRNLNSFKYLKIHSSQWLIINVFWAGLSEFWWRTWKKIFNFWICFRTCYFPSIFPFNFSRCFVSCNGIYNEPQLLHISIYINNTMIAGEYGNATRKYTSSLDASVKVLTFNWNFEKCHDLYGNWISLNSH